MSAPTSRIRADQVAALVSERSAIVENPGNAPMGEAHVQPRIQLTTHSA
jgi:hypothetical protein